MSHLSKKLYAAVASSVLEHFDKTESLQGVHSKTRGFNVRTTILQFGESHVALTRFRAEVQARRRRRGAAGLASARPAALRPSMR